MIKPDELIKLCLLSPQAYNTIKAYGLEHIRWLYKDKDLDAVNALDGLMQRYPTTDPIVALAKEPRIADTLRPYEEGGAPELVAGLALDLEQPDSRTEATKELLDYVQQMATTGKRALEDATAQRIIDALEEDSSTDVTSLVADREMDLRKAGGVGRLEHLGDILDEEKAKPIEPRYKTGLYSLDDALDGGFRTGTICTILASPGCGKTSLMGQILLSMTHNNPDCAALWFSLEQTRAQTINGVCSFVEGQGYHAHASDKLIRDLPIKFNDDISDITDIVDMVKIEKRRDPNLKVVVIDYVQLLEHKDCRNDLFQLMFTTSKMLKDLSRREELIVLVAAQIDKDSYMGNGKTNKPPTLFSVKGGGDLTQASSYMLGLHRPAPDNEDNMKGGYNVLTDVLILKNRFGRMGYSFHTWFDGRHRCFRPYVDGGECDDTPLL